MSCRSGTFRFQMSGVFGLAVALALSGACAYIESEAPKPAPIVQAQPVAKPAPTAQAQSVAKPATAVVSQGRVFPGPAWTVVAPGQVRLDKAKLDAFAKAVGGRGCVVRHGYMAYTWGDAAQRADIASAAKPFYSHFLFLALQDRRITPNLDQKLLKWEPRLLTLNEKIFFKDRNITWWQLATQTSCYGVDDWCGESFDYNDYQMALFFDTLFLKVYGAAYETIDAKVLHPLLTDLIGCEDKPTFLAFGTRDRPGRLAISPRDFARFGWLYLNKGRWAGRQILMEQLATLAVSDPLPIRIPRTKGKAAEMIPGQRTIGSTKIPDDQCDHGGSYSWLWWVNGADRTGRRRWPDAPFDVYGAFGHDGQRAMVVFPRQDMIVSWNDTSIQGLARQNWALQVLRSAAADTPAAPPSAPQLAAAPAPGR